MAALTSGSWTVGYPSGDRSVDTSITNRKKYVNLKLTLASGEMPSAGILLPAAGQIGLTRNLDFYMMPPKLATASGRSVFYTLTSGHKVRAFQNILASGLGRTFQPFATTITNAARIFHLTGVGW